MAGFIPDAQRASRWRPPVHPFPARMAPEIALETLENLASQSAVVLDPMVGSGTTLVAARASGLKAIGFDTDPLAVLVATAATRRFRSGTLLTAAEACLERATRSCRQSAELYPSHADQETRAFIRYWFEPATRRQLTALAAAITSQSNRTLRPLLWCAFSRLIIAKDRSASLARDLVHSRPHRCLDRVPLKPLAAFQSAIYEVLRRAQFCDADVLGPSTVVRRGDARRLALPSQSVDVILTSPPYLNAIDYLRAHKFALVWMGWRIGQLRKIRAASIGTEVGLAAQPDSALFRSALKSTGRVNRLPLVQQRMVHRFIWDMQQVLSEMARTIRPRGSLVLVVGDCSLGGVRLWNSQVARQLATGVGFSLRKIRRRRLPANRRYLPPPDNRGVGGLLRRRMNYETVVEFRKEH